MVISSAYSNLLLCLSPFFISCLFLVFFVIFVFSWAPSVAYGGSQARGWIGAVALGPHHSSWHRLILNPRSEARSQTHVLMDTSRIRYRGAMTGTPLKNIFREGGLKKEFTFYLFNLIRFFFLFPPGVINCYFFYLKSSSIHDDLNPRTF